MNQELRTIHDLIRAVWGIQVQAWQKNEGPYAPHGSHKKTYDMLKPRITSSEYTTQEELEKHLLSLATGKFDTGRRLLLMPPVLNTNGYVPILSMRMDMNGQSPDVSICIRMYKYYDNSLECLPLRFESGSGIHSFYHSQLGVRDVSPQPPWIDDSQPSFALPALCPSTLLVSTLLSVYGLELLKHVIPNHSSIHKIKDCLDRKVSLRQILSM